RGTGYRELELARRRNERSGQRNDGQTGRLLRDVIHVGIMGLDNADVVHRCRGVIGIEPVASNPKANERGEVGWRVNYLQFGIVEVQAGQSRKIRESGNIGDMVGVQVQCIEAWQVGEHRSYGEIVAAEADPGELSHAGDTSRIR